MSETLDVGIIVPLYNKASTVRRTVERLVDQTVRPARVVVVDDGSSDDSVSALAPLEGRFTLIRQANAGPSAARNRGVAELTTEWVAFADADNLWDARRLERVRDFLRQHPDIDWLAGRYWNVFPNGRREAAPAWAGEDSTFVYFDRAAELGGLHCPETLVVRRALFQEVGGFNERLRCYEITQMYLQLAALRPVAGLIAEPTVEFFPDTPTSLYREKGHAPAALRAYAEELLAVYGRLTPAPAYLSRLIQETMTDCVYYACRGGEFELARAVLREHGKWLRPAARWKVRLRCLAARWRGREKKRMPSTML